MQKNNSNTSPLDELQNVTSERTAIFKATAVALLAMLVPLLTGFAYLILLREPIIERDQVSNIASAYANQQAANVQQLISRLGKRVQSAAQSSLAQSAINPQNINQVQAVEASIMAYFPELISLHLIPIGEVGTADLATASTELRNHIEVDLVRRASIGNDTQVVAFQFEGQWLASMAYLVSHPQDNRQRAVILASVNQQLLIEELGALDSSAGQSVLQQSYTNAAGKEIIDDIAAVGSGTAQSYTRYAELADSSWRIAFTPSQSLLDSQKIHPLSLTLVLALLIIASLASIGLLVHFFRRTIDNEVSSILALAHHRSPLILQLPPLLPLARQLRQLNRQHEPLEDSPELEKKPLVHTEELANPMFHKDNILDSEESSELEEESLELELDLDPTAGDEASSNVVPTHIFRAYDIRGHADNELTDELVSLIGAALGTIVQQQGEQTLIIGSDGRRSSPRIKTALLKAIAASGCNVIDIGLVATPLLYYATMHLDAKSGVMITGSHNPADDNGLKIVLNQQTIAAGGIQEIRDTIAAGQFASGTGRITSQEIGPAYIDEVVSDIALAVPLKIVIDAGNGATSQLAPALFTELGCEVVPLYCEVDGEFPNHPPDTSNEDNLSDLVAAVRAESADLGVAFDGDGDRLAVVTSSGRIVRPDVLLMLFAQDVLSRNPGADIVFDVKCSRNLTRMITRYGGRPVLWKTGHAFMKEKMRETGALLGGEFSGHLFFGERWFGFDDGMYAAGRLTEILSSRGTSLDKMLSEIPTAVSTPEILIPVSEEDKFSIMADILEHCDFSSGKVNTLDGVRVDYMSGWGLIRASNTSAYLTARFEASSDEALENIKQVFRSQIGRAAPGLKLNF